MPFSAGYLSLEPEKVMATRWELHTPSSLPGAVSSNAVPDTGQCSRSRCHRARRAADHRNPMVGTARGAGGATSPWLELGTQGVKG